TAGTSVERALSAADLSDPVRPLTSVETFARLVLNASTSSPNSSPAALASSLVLSCTSARRERTSAVPSLTGLTLSRLSTDVLRSSRAPHTSGFESPPQALATRSVQNRSMAMMAWRMERDSRAVAGGASPVPGGYGTPSGTYRPEHGDAGPTRRGRAGA